MKEEQSHIPSIFNDVVGPVMRGPSSSHNVAALRIGRICRELMRGAPGRVEVSYDSGDALATTHESQGSDMGMKGGLLGYEADDPRLLDPDPYLEQEGIDLSFLVRDTDYDLPNLYLVHLQNQKLELEVAAVSTGGGMMEIFKINQTEVSIKGDRDEDIWISPSGEVATDSSPPPGFHRCRIPALLPTRFQQDAEALFANCRQMLDHNQGRDLSAWELAAAYESRLGGMKEEEVFQKMLELYRVMRNGVKTGLQGTSFKDRIYGAQSQKYQKQMEAGSLAGDQVVHLITLYVSAFMEVKSSMGVIIAAPTAGSCGTFPGAVLGVADAMKLEEEQIVKALLAGSLTGIFIATASTFSAEIGGCQAECGSGAGMAAAAIVSLLGGNVEQSMAASSLALQNSLGMICDPIAARVEAPCLGKNTSSALNALASANMIMAGYDHLIPLDEVIDTMDKVGKSLPRELRCTALGGLAVTPSAREIEKRLTDQQGKKS